MRSINKKYGYIKFHPIAGEIVFIDEFVIYKKYRGKGFARKLASFLPKGNLQLMAYPMFGMAAKFAVEDLMKFYRKLGFRKKSGERCSYIMVRKAKV